MRRAATALRILTARITRDVGLEGAFLILGTASLAVGSSFFTPAGPYLVVGCMAVLVAFALVVPARRS